MGRQSLLLYLQVSASIQGCSGASSQPFNFPGLSSTQEGQSPRGPRPPSALEPWEKEKGETEKPQGP